MRSARQWGASTCGAPAKEKRPRTGSARKRGAPSGCEVSQGDEEGGDDAALWERNLDGFPRSNVAAQTKDRESNDDKRTTDASRAATRRSSWVATRGRTRVGAGEPTLRDKRLDPAQALDQGSLSDSSTSTQLNSTQLNSPPTVGGGTSFTTKHLQ